MDELHGGGFGCEVFGAAAGRVAGDGEDDEGGGGGGREKGIDDGAAWFSCVREWPSISESWQNAGGSQTTVFLVRTLFAGCTGNEEVFRHGCGWDVEDSITTVSRGEDCDFLEPRCKMEGEKNEY